MKMRTLLAPVIVGLLTQFGVAQAADWYAANIRGTCKFVDGSDRIVRRAINNNILIQEYLATLSEPPPARSLKVAYNPEADQISIVNTNGERVVDLYAFGSATVAANSSDTLRERHVFLFTGDDSVASGTAQMTERIVRTEETVTRFTSTGKFQFAIEGTEETPAQICSGTFSIGKKLNLTPPEPPTP